MVAKRIRTAEISVMDKADRDYLKMSAKLECRKEISALDMAIYKAECLYSIRLIILLNENQFQIQVIL